MHEDINFLALGEDNIYYSVLVIVCLYKTYSRHFSEHLPNDSHAKLEQTRKTSWIKHGNIDQIIPVTHEELAAAVKERLSSIIGNMIRYEAPLSGRYCFSDHVGSQQPRARTHLRSCEVVHFHYHRRILAHMAEIVLKHSFPIPHVDFVQFAQSLRGEITHELLVVSQHLKKRIRYLR